MFKTEQLLFSMCAHMVNEEDPDLIFVSPSPPLQLTSSATPLEKKRPNVDLNQSTKIVK